MPVERLIERKAGIAVKRSEIVEVDTVGERFICHSARTVAK